MLLMCAYFAKMCLNVASDPLLGAMPLCLMLLAVTGIAGVPIGLGTLLLGACVPFKCECPL
jgi:hypothetical protein